jgi:hypothetical protein
MPQNIEPNIKNEGSSLSIADAPDDEHGRSLYFVSMENNDTGGSGDGFAIKTETNGSSCLLFESDIYVSENTEDTTFFQIKLGDAYMLVFTKNGDSIDIKEATSTSGNRTTITTVSTETWFRLRVEYYVNGESQNGLAVPEIKVFIDEEHISTSNRFFGSHAAGKAPDNDYAKLNVLSLRAATSYVYMDNIFCSIEDKLYSDTDHEIGDSRG